MRTVLLIVVAFCALWGCSKGSAPASGQQATVSLNDGTTFSGTVTSSSASAISIQSPTGESRTYPMSQVSSVQYAQAGAPPAQTQAQTQTPSAAAPPLPQTTPAPASAPPPLPPPTPPTTADNARNGVPAPPSARAQPVAEFRTIPAGSTISVRNNEAIDSQTAEVGQTFSGVIESAVVDADGRVAIPRGANATLVVRGSAEQGKIQGRSELAVDVSAVEVGGRTYRLETSDFVEKGRDGLGKNKRTGAFVGGGAALGGIIGAIAGGGKGAAIGALSGAGAGTATQGLTRGKAVRIPSETLLTFKLESPVRIRELR
jgi:hypothetical protein